jgi:CHASE3 domain sensor protein
MTTKLKIIVGFSVMIVLVGVIAGIGNMGLNSAADSFDDYRRLARADVNSSNSLVELLSSTSSLRLFRLTRDPAHADEAMKNLDNMAEGLNSSESLLRLQANRDALKNVRAQMESIRKFTDEIKELTLRFEHEYRTVMIPLQRQVKADLIAMVKASSNAGNTRAVALEAEAMNVLAYNRSAISRFAMTATQVNSERTQEMADNLKKKVD